MPVNLLWCVDAATAVTTKLQQPAKPAKSSHPTWALLVMLLQGGCAMAGAVKRTLPAKELRSRVSEREQNMDYAFGEQHWLANEDFEAYAHLLQGRHVTEFLW